jgi:hypothetical protein
MTSFASISNQRKLWAQLTLTVPSLNHSTLPNRLQLVLWANSQIIFDRLTRTIDGRLRKDHLVSRYSLIHNLVWTLSLCNRASTPITTVNPARQDPTVTVRIPSTFFTEINMKAKYNGQNTAKGLYTWVQTFKTKCMAHQTEENLEHPFQMSTKTTTT